MAGILAKAAAILAAAGGTALCTAGWSTPGDPSGTQRFVLTSHSTAPTPVYRAVAGGVFHAAGTAQATGRAATAPLKMTFPGGTFLITQVSAGKPSGSINATTCVAHYSETGVKYTVGSGTGKYAGIKGSGSADIKFTGTLPKLSNGKCDESPAATPMAGTASSVIDASGPVTMP
jgi:hypothetical protein